MLLCAVLVCLVALTTGQICTISVKNGTLATSLPSPSPLLLKPGGSLDGFGFLLPSDSQGTITLKRGEQILLACPGPQNYLQPLQPLPVTKTSQLVQEATVSCVSGSNFMSGNKSLTFRELACKNQPFHSAKKSNNNCNNDKGVKIGIMIEIGFQISTGFYKLIDVCFDESQRNAIYSKFDLVAGIGGAESGTSRQVFLPGNPSFYPGIDPDNLYKQIRLNGNISSLLGSPSLQSHSLGKGHLTASIDFVYVAQRRAAYYYVNAAPQWQTFDEQNWNKLENNIREYASTKKLNLKVYTGTHGITTLTNARELFLHDEGPGKRFIPVPRLFWKVVYDPKSNAGVAIIGVNNPYVGAGQSSALYNICPDISHNISWIKWNTRKQEWGYGYCCDFTRFKQVVNTLPSTIVVNRLLL